MSACAAASAHRVQLLAATAIGCAAAVTASGVGWLPDPEIAGLLAAGSSLVFLFQPRHAWAAAMAGGALAGLTTGLLPVLGIPFPVAALLVAVAIAGTARLTRARRGFAPDIMREEALLIVCLLGLVVAVLPSVLDGWQAAATLNVRVENGVIDGNNSRSGVAVMFEDGSNDGLARNVDVIRQANGAFSAFSPGVDFIDVRSFDSINHDQGRGHPMSNGVQFNIAASGARFDDVTYTRPGNPGNIVWEAVDAALLDIRADPNAVPMSYAPFVNDWDW